MPCRRVGRAATRSSWFCYSDVPHMFRERGLADGNRARTSTRGPYPVLEYPVLIGFVMWITAAIARTAGSVDAGAVRFFDVTALVMIAASVITLIVMVRLLGRRPWDAAMFALAPVLILSGFINWDLLAVALTTGALLAWARRQPVLAGVLIGLGMATKLYPLFLLGPILLLCLRTRRTPRARPGGDRHRGVLGSGERSGLPRGARGLEGVLAVQRPA